MFCHKKSMYHIHSQEELDNVYNLYNPTKFDESIVYSMLEIKLNASTAKSNLSVPNRRIDQQIFHRPDPTVDNRLWSRPSECGFA